MMKKALSVLVLVLLGTMGVAYACYNNFPTCCYDVIENYYTTEENSYYGGGVSWSGITRHLTGEYMEYLNLTFVTRTELEDAHERMDWIQAQINLPGGADMLQLRLEEHRIRADRLQETQHFGDYICVPGNVCLILETVV